MSEMLRAFDANVARRRVRDLLWETSMAFGLDRRRIPHTYDTEELIEHAEKVLRRRDVRASEYYNPLLLRTGVVYCLTEREEVGRELFERGIKANEYSPERALFLYAIGHWIHFRNESYQHARRILLDALECAERGRRLRTEIEILTGRTHRIEGDLPAAHRIFERVTDRGILELRPMAFLEHAHVLALDGDTKAARKANDTARARMRGPKDWRLLRRHAANRALILRREGKLDEALEVQRSVVEESHRRLDVDRLGPAYNDFAILCRELDDRDGAYEAYRQALRYFALKRTRWTSIVHRNLANVLNDAGQHDASLAALERAIETAREVGSPGDELLANASAAGILAARGGDESIVAGLLARAEAILDATEGQIEARAVSQFARIVGRVGVRTDVGTARESRRLATGAGRAELKRLIAEAGRNDFGRQIEESLGEGMGFNDSPEPRALARFLMLFTGEPFKSMSYQREFQSSQPRAKYHLQWLVGKRVLERMGTRKASNYVLAFHRTG